MSPSDEGSSIPSAPPWALQQAAEELDDTADVDAVAERGREIAREGRARDDERHDAYDDPDQGGEA